MNKKQIYLDSAATSKLLPCVQEVIKDSMQYFGNPSSLYSEGQIAYHMLDHARRDIADAINCEPEELIFTSCGSESNCQALFSTFDYAQAHGMGNHIVTSAIEHHSTLSACDYLAKYRGAEITYVGVDEFGRVDPADVAAAVGLNTCLISIMDSNNEIGTIQAALAFKQIADEHGIFYHSDCVQSFMKRPLDLDNYDMFSASGHKIGAPKGVGLLYHQIGTPLLPLIHGTQEDGLRGGTSNVLFAVALAEAVKYHANNMSAINEHIARLSDHMKNRILAEIPGARLNGHPSQRLVNNLNFTFPEIRGEEALILLDMQNVQVSTGSACNSSSGEPSHVLKAIRLSDDLADASLRISLSEDISIEDADFAVDRIKDVVRTLRERN